MRSRCLSLAVSVSLAPASGCSELNPEFDEFPPATAGSTTTGGSGSSSAGPTTPSPTSAATSSADGSSGSDDPSTTAPPPCDEDSCLVDREVVVRYFIDEAAEGQRPGVLSDAIDPPLDLFLSYVPEMAYTEQQSGRGLSWSMASVSGTAWVGVDGTKLVNRLQGSTTATIEVVLRMTAVESLGSRISHVGDGTEKGFLSLSSSQLGILQFHWQETVLLEEWNVGASITERSVVHVVVNTEAEAEDRVVLYFNGAAVSPSDESPPPAGAPIDLSMDEFYVLGNRENGERSFAGELYYAAIYQSALTQAEIEANFATLDVFDDR